MAGQKKGRTRLTLQQKLDAIEMLGKGSPYVAVMSRFNVSHRFVRRLKKEGDELLRKADSQKLSLNTKSIRQTLYPEVENKVFEFCEIARGLRLPVTQDLIRERALLVRENILKSESLSDETRTRVSKFSASVG